MSLQLATLDSSSTVFPVPPVSDEDAAAVEQLVAGYQARFGSEQIVTINPADEMFNVLRQNANCSSLADAMRTYLQTGENLMRDLEAVFEAVGFGWSDVDQFLDFACGYGRLTRFLASRLGPDHVTAADITPAMVNFVTTTFGVDGFVSAGDPSQVVQTKRYDAIYVVSLFSHLPYRTWADFLGTLYSWLNPGGIVVFSTTGPDAYRVFGERGWIPGGLVTEAPGFQYSGLNETAGRLGGDIYGSAFVTREFVEGVVAERGYGTLRTCLPMRIGNLQDAYVIQR